MIRKGWTVGISSRGVGSLKVEDGKNIVQDDFELICWDIVTSPSTPGSWISSEVSDLKQFTESTQNKFVNNTNVKSSSYLNEDQKRIIDNLNKFLL
jgi:hypothetical protein